MMLHLSFCLGFLVLSAIPVQSQRWRRQVSPFALSALAPVLQGGGPLPLPANQAPLANSPLAASLGGGGLPTGGNPAAAGLPVGGAVNNIPSSLSGQSSEIAAILAAKPEAASFLQQNPQVTQALASNPQLAQTLISNPALIDSLLANPDLINSLGNQGAAVPGPVETGPVFAGSSPQNANGPLAGFSNNQGFPGLFSGPFPHIGLLPEQAILLQQGEPILLLADQQALIAQILNYDVLPSGSAIGGGSAVAVQQPQPVVEAAPTNIGGLPLLAKAAGPSQGIPLSSLGQPGIPLFGG